MYSWPEFKHLHTINAHPANCICIEFDKSGRCVYIHANIHLYLHIGPLVTLLLAVLMLSLVCGMCRSLCVLEHLQD